MLRHACLSCRWMVSTSQVADAVETVAVSHAACSLLKLAVKGIPSLSFTTGRQLSASASIAVANGIAIDDTAVQRLRELQAESPNQPIMLRVEVEGGGCSGFQYKFKLDTSKAQDDLVFERDGVAVVCDPVSLDFLKGAVVEYEDSLMRSAFQISINPNAEASCGCGTSFAAKF